MCLNLDFKNTDLKKKKKIWHELLLQLVNLTIQLDLLFVLFLNMTVWMLIYYKIL